MNIKGTVSRWGLWIGVALLGMPGLAAAQNALLYEVTETMKLTGLPTRGVRTATATLMGKVDKGTVLCPAVLAEALGIDSCGVVAHATDNLNLATGQGPVVGRFSVVVQGDNPVDGAELTIASGDLRGHIDLSPALLKDMPVGTLEGRWSARGRRGGPLDGLRLEGTLTGVFRLPFVYTVPPGCAQKGDVSGCLWVSKPSYWVGGPVPMVGVEAHEHSLGVPTVRLELNFIETR